MEHDYYSMTQQKLKVVVTHPSLEGEPKVIPVGDPIVAVGCLRCNMPLEEALTLPCPGRPVEQMLN